MKWKLVKHKCIKILKEFLFNISIIATSSRHCTSKKLLFFLENIREALFWNWFSQNHCFVCIKHQGNQYPSSYANWTEVHVSEFPIFNTENKTCSYEQLWIASPWFLQIIDLWWSFLDADINSLQHLACCINCMFTTILIMKFLVIALCFN